MDEKERKEMVERGYSKLIGMFALIVLWWVWLTGTCGIIKYFFG